jgi:hypothetical protein
MPPINNSPTVSSLSQSIQSGSMNVTVRRRPSSGFRQPSADRRTIPGTIHSTQRRVSNDTTRSRLSGQDQSVTTNGAFERRDSNANNEESSDDHRQKSHSPSSLDSKLQHGGLTGLQNLGNTVIIFFLQLNINLIFF